MTSCKEKGDLIPIWAFILLISTVVIMSALLCWHKDGPGKYRVESEALCRYRSNTSNVVKCTEDIFSNWYYEKGSLYYCNSGNIRVNIKSNKYDLEEFYLKNLCESMGGNVE